MSQEPDIFVNWPYQENMSLWIAAVNLTLMCAFAYIQLQCTQVQTKTDGENVIFSRKEEPFGLTST